MRKYVSNFFMLMIVLILALQLIGCGTLLYPERQGQGKGDIDPTVLLLDGIGVIFFVVPGLVAFIVDFSTGAIYLPPGKSTKQRLKELKGDYNIRIEEQDGRTVLFVNPDQLNPNLINQVVQTATGVSNGTSHPKLEAYKLDGLICFPEENAVVAGQYGTSGLRFN